MEKKSNQGRGRGSGPVKRNSGPQHTALRALSDEELAWQSQQGCQVCFAELVQRYGPRLVQFLRRKTNNLEDAEDLVQDTFIKAYGNIHRYRSCWKFSTWLFTIAARLASSYHRSLHRSQKVPTIKSGSLEPADVMAHQEAQQSLWAMARSLSTNQYQALWLKYAEDMSIKEIAKVLGKSQVCVKVLLYRARMNLGERLRNIAAEDKAADQTSSEETMSFMKVEGA